MRCYLRLFVLFFVWGCSGTPFLIDDFGRDYKPKIKTIAALPFSIPTQNSFAEKHRLELEEGISATIARGDSLRSYLFPERVRASFLGAADSSILRLPADSSGKLFSAEALLFSRIIRLYESEGSNPTTRQVGASKFQWRGVELLMEFRLIEAATGKLLWKYRVRRFGEDAEAAGQLVGQAAAEAWPLRS